MGVIKRKQQQLKTMKYFKYDSLKEEPFESGEITKEDFEILYSNFPWIEMLKKQNNAKDEDVKCSPGIVVRNQKGKEVYVSIVGEIEEYEFYICYKRPTLRKKRKWFKIVEFMDENYYSIIPEQTLEDGLKASLCLFDEDFQTLENRYG